MSEIDWVAVKTEFVTTKISLRKLSEKYHTDYNNLRIRAMKEKWTDERARVRKKTYNKTINRITSKNADKLTGLMTASERLLNQVSRALEDDQQLNRQLVRKVEKQKDGSAVETTEERIYNKIDTRAVNDLTRSLKDLSQLMREFYAIPTPAEAEAQRIAAERLKLEQAKADSNKPDSEIIVRFADDSTEDYSD